MRLNLLPALTLSLLLPATSQAACCYFSAKNADILQPAQKVFITWDPSEKVETFTVQPKFEGNALDFGMVIPTPSQPKLHEMPRDFFKHLAVYTIMKKREFAALETAAADRAADCRRRSIWPRAGPAGGSRQWTRRRGRPRTRQPAIKILEAGIVGSLDYKIIEAGRADDLFNWLKDNKYSYSGDEATLNHYVQKKWIFTVMKIDTMQMKRNKDGTFAGEVTPTRFQFASREARLSAQDHANFRTGKDRGSVLRAGPLQGRFAGRLDVSVYLGADAASGHRLHAGRHPGRRRAMAQGVRAADSAAVGPGQPAQFPLRRRPAPASEQQGAHPDDDGMGSQTDEERHRHRHGQGAVLREGAGCR